MTASVPIPPRQTAVDALQPFHIDALRNAYALMSAAAETGKPYASWAHHTRVGGARTADQLVERGLLARSLDSHKGDIETYRYRITPDGCDLLARPYLVKEPTVMQNESTLKDLAFAEATTPTPDALPETSDTVRRIAGTLSADQLHMLVQIADVVPVEPRNLNTRHMLIERALVTPIGDANHWTHTLTPTGREVVAFLRADAASVTSAPDVVIDDTDDAPEPPVTPAPGPDFRKEIDELRFDRDALINTQIKLEMRVKDAEVAQATYKKELDAALTALHAIGTALADAHGVIPDDLPAALAALRESHALALESKDLHIADLNKMVDAAARQTAELHEEVDSLKREVNGLKIQLSQAAGTERGIEYERDIDILSAQIQQRELAGWVPWHKWNDGAKLIVEWRRDPSAKRKARTRTGNTGAHVHVPQPVIPRPSVPAASTALTGDAFIMPEEAPRPASRSGYLGDAPADPYWNGKRPQPIADRPRDRSRTPRPDAPAPLSSVMDTFTRNLNNALEANPIPPVTPLSHFTRS